MSKMHEVLAVESGLKATVDSIIKEAINTFDKKQGHFDGFTKTYQKRDNDDTEILNDEVKTIVTTVPDKLKYIQESFIRMVDCIAQKEFTNTKAQADIVLENGEILYKNVPATFLLQLETQLKRIREVYQAALTLDPTKTWIKSTQIDNVYVTEPTKTARSRKEAVVLTLAPPTDKHPAQVQVIQKDVQVGDWTIIFSSGAITPREKSNYLAKIDVLERAVKKARVRANEQEVTDISIGKKLFDFIVE